MNKLNDLCDLSILVTGGAGFIGSNIVEYLVKHNVKLVRILDNLSTGKYENIKEFVNLDNVEFINGDMTDFDTCLKVLDGINVVSHQAALGSVPRSVDNPIASNFNNVNGTLNLLWACKKLGIKRFIYASSSSVYGDDKKLPKTEESTGNPLSPYAVTKCVGESYAKVFTDLFGMECIGLRYFNVFGPKQDPKGAYAAVIPKFIDLLKNGKRVTINGDGSFSRDFTYVDNVVYGNMLAMLHTGNDEVYGKAYNIGTGGRITLIELYNAIKKAIGTDLEPIFGSIRKGDIPHSNASVSLAVEKLNYKPLVNFKSGIEKTIKYFVK